MKITKKNLEKLIIEELEAVQVGASPETIGGARRSMAKKGPLEGALNKYADQISAYVDWMLRNDQHGPARKETLTDAENVLTELQLALRMMLKHAMLRYDHGAQEGDRMFLDGQADLEAKLSIKEIIKQELYAVLNEGMLEDPIEQSGSEILSMLDGQGFRTRGFMESLVNTIKMEAEKTGKDPADVAEDELLKMRKGMDDLGDRIGNTLMTYFPRGGMAPTDRKTNED
tara:strand:+ start:2414 stop:3100 length:687 start_codon:yes stop_codon:yes gene_type:complete